MSIEFNPKIPGIVVWDLPKFIDIRGCLIKDLYPGVIVEKKINFQVVEQFFTISQKGVFRGMHFQDGRHPASKIVSIVQGKILDFVIDLRKDSPTFKQFFSQQLLDTHPKAILIPPGVAHGYLAMEDRSIVSYKYDNKFCKNCDSGVSWELIKEYLPEDSQCPILSNRDFQLPFEVKLEDCQQVCDD